MMAAGSCTSPLRATALRRRTAARVFGALAFVCAFFAALGTGLAHRSPASARGVPSIVTSALLAVSHQTIIAATPAPTREPPPRHERIAGSNQDTDANAILPTRSPTPALALRSRSSQGGDSRPLPTSVVRPAAAALGPPAASALGLAIEGDRIAELLDRTLTSSELGDANSARGPPRARSSSSRRSMS